METKLKNGLIVLFRKDPSIFISRAISAITGSSYSHVGIIREYSDKEVVVAEALHNGFVHNKYPRKVFDGMITTGSVYLMKSTKDLDYVTTYIDKYVDKPYGYLDILLILVYRLTGKRLFKGSAMTLICSEAVSRVLYDASNGRLDMTKEYDKPHSYITPDDLFMSKQLKAYNWYG